MQITCPHCTTSYAVDPAKFGASGRKVRCARCHGVWQAHPEEVAALASVPEPAFAAGAGARPAPSLHPSATDWREEDAPHIESPSISAGWDEADTDAGASDRITQASDDMPAAGTRRRWARGFGRGNGTGRPARGLRA
jgi:predicted Zn finger-like uncharacterized protein